MCLPVTLTLKVFWSSAPVWLDVGESSSFMNVAADLTFFFLLLGTPCQAIVSKNIWYLPSKVIDQAIKIARSKTEYG